MTHHKLTPDVPGQLGDDTELDRSVHPPRVQRLAYVIDNWLGTIEEEAHETLPLTGRTEFPDFRWLHITGKPGQHDFGLTGKGDLVVSDRALNVLRQGQLDRCDIEEYGPTVHQ